MPSPDGPPRRRLAPLDGLRGLAALYVVLHHAALEARAPGMTPGAGLVVGLLRYGHYAVAVFIVLSGYGLMRPVALDPSGRLEGGLPGFLGRRARRILPPYYAALGLCWALIALAPALGRPAGVRWDFALPASGPGVVASHLLLVQNWSPAWFFRVDPPAWTVATEWQIYLLFPALLAARRRLGAAATVAVAFGAGWAVAWAGWTVGNPATIKLCPWYLGLFALGMAAATVEADGPRIRPVAWGLAVAFALGVPLAWNHPSLDQMLLDPAVGALTALGVARLARGEARGESSSASRLLESRPALALGSASYSLYLIHFPLLALIASAFRSRGLGPTALLGAMLLVAAPLCVGAAWPFARLFERPARRPSSRDRVGSVSAGSAGGRRPGVGGSPGPSSARRGPGSGPVRAGQPRTAP